MSSGKPATKRSHAGDLRAASRLAIRATQGVTAVVEDMHHTIASGPAILGRPWARVSRVLTGAVYGHIRNVTGLVGVGIDAALAQAAPILGASAPGPAREAVLAALNGVIGDHLAETSSPLAIPMTLRHEGEPLPSDPLELAAALPVASGKILLLVHGSSMSDLQWRRFGHDHGAVLARELGYTPVYVRYNSGLHISTNGRELASQLEALVSAWPVKLRELAILGHSMGGLVARSACDIAETEGLRWRSALRKLAGLGCPHHGSPIERGGNWVDTLLGVSAYSAPLARLGKIRSAGVTDMRFGSVADEDWKGLERFDYAPDGRRRVALPLGVDCYAIAATTAREMSAHLPGDGLVPLRSALGQSDDPSRTLAFPQENQWIALGARHLDLLSRADVCAKLGAWFSA